MTGLLDEHIIAAVGNAIWEQRSHAGLKMGAVAAAAGIPDSRYESIERGQTEPSILEFIRGTRAIKTTPRDLATRLDLSISHGHGVQAYGEGASHSARRSTLLPNRLRGDAPPPNTPS